LALCVGKNGGDVLPPLGVAVLERRTVQPYRADQRLRVSFADRD
jgi:hypothetical protein